ncbi:MAG TPA: N-acetyl-alpha-D-glucosaminyl L-malate synthase BshA, partial [Terriglobales bacterium]|nr:N-acetyl-alpha-D-glucosaminyl L-malate synthase BshA [Terriglobales bacterium]
ITLIGADPSYLPITRFAIEASDGTTAISQYLRERTIKEMEVRTPVEVIYNFVNCDTYQRDADARKRRAAYADAGERLVVHLSNFRPVKRVTDVVEVFDRIQKQLPARLLMIGDGPERSAAEWLVRRKGLQERVNFAGKQDRVHEKLPMADLMLLPSQLESFGLAALEAMACEVVPVATRVGGVPEVIEHGKTGFLAEVGDVEAMARDAVGILSDETRLREMGQVARREARKRFCSNDVIPKYEEFYRGVLERAS